MNKAQKELIEKASIYDLGKPLSSLLIIPTGKQYNGFWGKNEYNNIKVVGVYNGEFYLVNDEQQVDVIDLLCLPQDFAKSCSLDVPNEFNCIRLFFREGLICIRSGLSSLMIEKYEGKNNV